MDADEEDEKGINSTLRGEKPHAETQFLGHELLCAIVVGGGVLTTSCSYGGGKTFGHLL